LVVAPYLAPRTREVLTERGISYADATGNLSLVADSPALWVTATGAAHDPNVMSLPLRSLKGPRAGRALRALVEFRPPFGVRELAARAGVSAPTLSRVIDLLGREELVERDDRGSVASVDWQGALRRWSLDYTLRTANHIVPCLDPRGLSHLVEGLASLRLDYAATSALAAEQLFPYAPARTAAIFVSDAAQARDRLGLRETDFGANVYLVEPFDSVAIERTVERGGLCCANPAQVVADLMTGPGREPSTAEELMRWMETNPDVWRR